MSHFTSLKTSIKNIPALSSACQELGISLLTGVKARGYGNQTIECDYCIHWENSPYDVAVIKQQNGEYTLTTDFYQGHIAKKLGNIQGNNEFEKNLGGLMQTYAKHTILQSALQNNLYLSGQKTTSDGKVVLTLTSY